jgi:hypothetical protein
VTDRDVDGERLTIRKQEVAASWMSLSFIAPDSITHLAAEEFCADDRFHHL